MYLRTVIRSGATPAHCQLATPLPAIMIVVCGAVCLCAAADPVLRDSDVALIAPNWIAYLEEGKLSQADVDVFATINSGTPLPLTPRDRDLCVAMIGEEYPSDVRRLGIVQLIRSSLASNDLPTAVNDVATHAHLLSESHELDAKVRGMIAKSIVSSNTHALPAKPSERAAMLDEVLRPLQHGLPDSSILKPEIEFMHSELLMAMRPKLVSEYAKAMQPEFKDSSERIPFFAAVENLFVGREIELQNSAVQKLTALQLDENADPRDKSRASQLMQSLQSSIAHREAERSRLDRAAAPRTTSQQTPATVEQLFQELANN